MTNENGKSGFVKTIKTQSFKRGLFFAIMMAYPILHFLVFYLIVNANSFLLAFKEYVNVDGVLNWEYSLKHFTTIFYELSHYPQNATMLYMFKNSLIVFATEIVVIIPSSILLSFYIYKGMPLGNAFKVIIFIPSIISTLALAIIYNSLVNSVIPNVFGVEKLLLQTNPKRVFGTLIVFTLMISFGVNILMYASTMSSIDQSLVEAAKIDGAGLGKEFFHVTLPACYSTISVFIVAAISSMFVNQLNMHAFFGSGLNPKISTVGYFLFVETVKAGDSISQYGYLSAWGLLLSAVVVPVTFLVRWLLNKVGPSEE